MLDGSEHQITNVLTGDAAGGGEGSHYDGREERCRDAAQPSRLRRAATEELQRLKPVNVYYHMYAGERAAQLAAVRRHLNEARKSFFTPIAASQYAAIEGFFTTEITALGGSTWRI